MFKIKALTEEQQRELVALSVRGYSYRKLATIFGLHHRTVGNYVREARIGTPPSLKFGRAFKNLAKSTGYRESYLKQAALAALSNEPMLLRNLLEEQLAYVTKVKHKRPKRLTKISVVEALEAAPLQQKA